MKEFSLSDWINRASRNRDSLLESGASKKTAQDAWTKEMIAVSDLEKIVNWCSEKRIKVSFLRRQNGVYYAGDNKIAISNRLSTINQVCVLLHECGHHLIGIDIEHNRFGMGYPQTDKKITKTFQHRFSCLEEEIEAWHRGWKLANRLGLELSREDFDQFRLKCLKSYLDWTLKPTESFL
jgi:hypothetical protein